MEVLESYESLASSLSIRDCLEKVSDPFQIINIVVEAIKHIGGWDNGKALQRLELQPSDSLAVIQRKVSALYRSVTIPRDYAYWYEEGKQEIAHAIEHTSGNVAILLSKPYKTGRQRRAVREGFSFGRNGETEATYNATINDRETFLRWRAAAEKDYQRRIQYYQNLADRFEQNKPAHIPSHDELRANRDG